MHTKASGNKWRNSKKTFGAKPAPQIRTTLRGGTTDSTLQSANHRAVARVRHWRGLESGRLPNRLTLVLALANHIKGKAHHCTTDLANIEGRSGEQQRLITSHFPDWFRGEEGSGCMGSSAQSDRYTETTAGSLLSR